MLINNSFREQERNSGRPNLDSRVARTLLTSTRAYNVLCENTFFLPLRDLIYSVDVNCKVPCCFQVGKNVLNQKSELQKAMDKHRDQAARKEAEKEKLNNKTPFEKVIEERARRCEPVSATLD